MSEFTLSRNDRGQLIHTGAAVVRQTRMATSSKPGTLQMLCPYGHFVDECETGTITASTWLADQSSGTPRVIECGGKLPAATEQCFLDAEARAQSPDGRQWSAAWHEAHRANGGGAAGSWRPEPWAAAVTRIADELERNLGLWSGRQPGVREKYEEALTRLRAAVGSDPRPLVFDLPGHVIQVN